MVLLAPTAAAQVPSGHVSVFVDHLPNSGGAMELRARVFLEERITPARWLDLNLAGSVEALAGDRGRFVHDVIARPQDLYAHLRGDRFDLRAGFTRIVWGRLDELQPSDVINPLDVSRFFFEGRSEARRAVALVSARVFLSEAASLEAVYVPLFRRGRFDELDEPTSQFNLLAETPIVRREPGGWDQAQGGLRLSATTGRVDWAVSAYRGIEPFGLFRQGSGGMVEELFPRFTMVAADFESVRGPWGVRGEVAAFVDDNLQLGPFIVEGRSLDAGVAVDRKAGDYRVSGGLLLHHEDASQPQLAPAGRTDVSVLGSAERSFRRDRYRLRTFGVVNATERSAFLRAIGTSVLRDEVTMEVSGGWFLGDGRDTISRFADRDFVYARLKVYF
jgi:hypothetical protein